MASWGDILDWCTAMDLALEPWERKALARLCHARAMIQAEVTAEAIKAANKNGRSRKT